MTTIQTPFSLGYRMPAEWARHASTWLAWPKDPTTFPGESVKRVEETYVQMIEALSRGERVDLLVDDQEAQERVSKMLRTIENLTFHRIRTADVWMRDYGPIFVKNGGAAATKWTFNAWGDKYDDLKPDDQVGYQIARSTGLRMFEPGIVLEGGSIDVNGLGSCITTEQCLLNRNRNPELRKNEIEGFLRDYLGVTNTIWLEAGIAGDDTDGHVDDLARFVNPDTVVCMVEEDEADENHAPLRSNFSRLKEARDQRGERLRVIPVQMPSRVDMEDGRLPASYANFYIGNDAVLVPVFDDPRDGQALETLRGLFPGRRVLGVNCVSLVEGFGAIHCVTQQQPATD